MLMKPYPHLQWNKVPQFKMLFDLQVQDNPVVEWKAQKTGRDSLHLLSKKYFFFFFYF